MNKCWVVQREVVTKAGEHITCHSRNGNHRILHSHQDGILHNLHIRSRARPQPHACHSIPCRDLHSRSYGIHQDRIHHIQSRAQQQPWAQPQPHACHSIPCRVLHSRSCGIHQDRIHHIQSRARQQPWVRPQPHACRSIPCRVLRSRSCGIHQDRIHHTQSRAQPQPHACRSILCRGLHIHSCGIHRIHPGRSLRSCSKAQQQPWVRPWPWLQDLQRQGPPGRELRASSCCQLLEWMSTPH